MLIRVRGHHGGIKEYLEKGQRHDREFERDGMDERVILAGDLDLTNDIIESIDTESERYLHVTLSFKEDEIAREILQEIVREFEAFAFSAYRSDEYAFYAEAHVPRVKSYTDRRSGDFVERKVHVHIVIPETNLLTGRRLEPFGKVDRNNHFINAFQEHINAKYGLASPKDNRRVKLSDASEVLGRYKGDAAQPLNRELRAQILDALVLGNVTRYEDFQTMLRGFGETRTRNAGRENAYENVKPPGADKGVNLKEFVFTRAFIELDADGKRAALMHNDHADYVNIGAPRVTPRALLDALTTWHDMRAREIKYLNSGSSFYKIYQEASPDERRHILEHREQRFYEEAGGLDGRARREDGRRGYGDWRDSRYERMPREPGDRGQSGEFGQQREGQQRRIEAALRESSGRWRGGADHDFDSRFDRPGASAGSAQRMRGLPSGGLDGDATRRQMLLPVDALLELGNQQAHRVDALRWTGDSGRTGREREGAEHALGPTGRRRAGAICDFDFAYDHQMSYGYGPRRSAPAGSISILEAIAARMYGAWDMADAAERARLSATAADKFFSAGDPFDGIDVHSGTFGIHRAFGGGQRAFSFGPGESVRSLADVQSLDTINSLPFEHLPVALPLASVPGTTAAPFNDRARATTGREADTLRDQFARDLVESRASRRTRERDEFAQIRLSLDATRLLAALAHSHGLVIGKYAVGKGADGGDRIRAGSRNLNVSDFLTKEMSLSWQDAAHLLRETYHAQTGHHALHAPRRSPEHDLWRDFLQWRTMYRLNLRSAWSAQAEDEMARRKAIKAVFYDTRSAFFDRKDVTATERREGLSAARVARLEAEAALRNRIRRERAALNGAARRPVGEQYLDFLQERAQAGDKRSLRELRRMRKFDQQAQHSDADRVVWAGEPPRRSLGAAQPQNEIIYSGPLITYEVRANGNVDYLKDGAALLVDEGRALRLWDSERDAIEIALRFAHQKFGRTLSLSGPEDFQAAAAQVAAELRMQITFDRPEVEQTRQVRVAELDAEALERRMAQRDRETWERDRLRKAVRNLPPADPDILEPAFDDEAQHDDPKVPADPSDSHEADSRDNGPAHER